MTCTRILILSIILSILTTGCIGKVTWVKRRGGEPEQNNWVPVCPKCNHVVDYDSLQCRNPECRTLLTWSDKVIYAREDQTAQADIESSKPVPLEPVSQSQPQAGEKKTEATAKTPKRTTDGVAVTEEKSVEQKTTGKESADSPAKVDKKGEAHERKDKQDDPKKKVQDLPEDDWSFETDDWVDSAGEPKKGKEKKDTGGPSE